MKANEVEQKISTALSSPLKRLWLICFSGLKHEYLYFVTRRPNQYHNANNAVCVVLKVCSSNSKHISKPWLHCSLGNTVDWVCLHWRTRHERQVARRIWIKLACSHGCADGRRSSSRSNCNGHRPWECCYMRWAASPHHTNAVWPPKLVPEQVILAAMPRSTDWASICPAV